MTRIDALREYRRISLVLVDGPEVRAQHPHSGVEPLQSGEGVNEDQVPRVTQADMSPFVSENRGIVGFVVTTIHDYIMHPAEGRQGCVTGHTDDGAILLGMLLAMLDKTDDSEQ